MSDLVLVSFVPGIDTSILLQSQQSNKPEQNETAIQEDKPRRRRARISGRFVADDLLTTDVNEAYEDKPVNQLTEEPEREN